MVAASKRKVLRVSRGNRPVESQAVSSTAAMEARITRASPGAQIVRAHQESLGSPSQVDIDWPLWSSRNQLKTGAPDRRPDNRTMKAASSKTEANIQSGIGFVIAHTDRVEQLGDVREITQGERQAAIERALDLAEEQIACRDPECLCHMRQRRILAEAREALSQIQEGRKA